MLEATIGELPHREIAITPSDANYRWRPLEAALAAAGSQSESILDYIEDEQESGRPKPIDIDYLLANVIPPILSVGGKLCLPIFANRYLSNQ